MKKLIYAYDLQAQLSRKKPEVCRERYIEGFNDALMRFKSMIHSAKAVDAVPVVRCKECIRRYDTDECPMCYLSGGQYVEYTSDDSYCSRGERKDGD